MFEKFKVHGLIVLYGTGITLFMYLAAIIWNSLGIKLNSFTGFLWYVAVITVGIYVVSAVDKFVRFVQERIELKRFIEAMKVKK